MIRELYVRLNFLLLDITSTLFVKLGEKIQDQETIKIGKAINAFTVKEAVADYCRNGHTLALTPEKYRANKAFVERIQLAHMDELARLDRIMSIFEP